jgi:hypothetical protein
LSQHLFLGLCLDVGAKLGHDSAKRRFVFLNYEKVVKASKEMKEEAGKKNYCYSGVNADLVYTFRNNASGKGRVDFDRNFSSHLKAQ